ncbi:hypothetical protein BGX27_004299 [Mortierella sp. AM989]|nr:hypothetical protein BGX27_004299 [Mortierella sp. AM989]
MPKRGGHRGSHSTRGSHGGSNFRQGRGGGRGGRGGRGGQGGQRGGRSSGFKRKHHSDEDGTGFIPLSGRQSEYYRQLQSAKNHGAGSAAHRRSKKERHSPVEVRFNRAVHTGPSRIKSKKGSDSEYDGSDQGLDSDEIDESEEEFLMQEFEWIEDDKDPNRKNKLTPPEVPNPTPETVIPITGWGGALAYHTSGQINGDLLGIIEEDTSSGSKPSTSQIDIETNREMEAQLATGQNDTKQTVACQRVPIHHTSITAITPSPLDHRQKKLKTNIDLSSEVQIKLNIADAVSVKDDQHSSTLVDTNGKSANVSDHESLLWVMDTEPDPVAADDRIRDPWPMVDVAEQIEIARAKASAVYLEDTLKKVQQVTTTTKGKSKKGYEPNTSMWMMDTTGEAVTEEVQEAYIDLPYDAEFSGHKRKKTHRSKRSGRKLRDKEKERVKSMIEDGGIMLKEDEDGEKDDDELALQDYLQNTMDSDDEDGADSFMGLLQGLHTGFGHSNDIGGLDPDDSDFDEDASQVDSHDDEDFDFTSKSSERKRKRRMNDGLSRALDGALSPSWPSDIPQGYEKFLDNVAQSLEGACDPGAQNRYKRGRRGEPHGGSAETLSDINRMVEEFVKGRDTQSLQLPHMKTALRRRVHLLSTHYGLRSESVGSGKRRFTVLMKTDHTKLPKNSDKVQTILSQSDREVKQIAVEFRQMHDRGYRGGQRYRSEGGPKRPPVVTITNGTVVGATAAPISTENVGHRLLAKMGWTPGGGLGASGSGITQPIEAVMKRTRRGLGHEQATK